MKHTPTPKKKQNDDPILCTIYSAFSLAVVLIGLAVLAAWR
jgi:hypothetical protein